MKRIKDFFYNFTDILIALLLVAIIAFILYFNLNRMINMESKKPVKQSQTTETNAADKKIEIDVTISEGLSNEQLAKILQAYSLVDDTKKFIEDLNAYKKDPVIKAGSYKITKGASNQEIFKLIIK